MAAGSDRANVHATAIAIGNLGVLIRGPSGSGKSDLALRCLALTGSPLAPGPCRLIADDRVELRCTDGGIELTCPPTLAGQLEVRAIGIVTVACMPSARLVLAVDLVSQSQAIERLPEPQTTNILGVPVPRIEFHPFETSAPLKLLLAMTKLMVVP